MLVQSATAIVVAVLSCLMTLFVVGVFEKPAVESEVHLETVQAPSKITPAKEVEQLQSAINNAAAERSQVTETVIQLNRDLEDLRAQVKALEEEKAERLSSVIETEQISTASSAERAWNNPPTNRRAQRQSGEERIESLVAAGVDVQTATDLQALRDQQRLARLELIDQATREGWSDSDQLQERLRELAAERVNFRDELGDDAYDRYLYESGNTNRVVIADIINGAAAETAGLQVGDAIITYNNEAIFQVRELQQATRSGTKGEYVEIYFERDGQRLSTGLPRGPLGVTLDSVSVSP